jgi:hypothetical protein
MKDKTLIQDIVIIYHKSNTRTEESISQFLYRFNIIKNLNFLLFDGIKCANLFTAET